ncbi:MAG: SecD/SecF family protein translocase subunit [Clostridia bacterium]|nr:SecD/SecF family protein translocase subunit [Clostridia bacterium]
MNKTMSIVWLCIIVVLIVALALFCFAPNMKIGVYDFTSPINNIKLGLDLKGGVYVTFEAEKYVTDDNGNYLDENGDILEDQKNESVRVEVNNFESALEGTAEVMQSRLKSKGYTEATVTVVDGYKLKVEIPDVDDVDDVLDILGNPANLKVKIGSEDGDDALLPNAGHIVGANAYYDTDSSSYAVQLEVNAEGQALMAKATAECGTTSSTIYFILDGEIIQQATVSTVINSKYSKITGIDTADQAINLAIQIQSGAYDIKFVGNALETKTIGAKLGEEAIQGTILAGIIVILLIGIFLILEYRLMGVAATLALSCYLVLLVLALCFIPLAQLTLPGIAGIILGIGMAVDANIIIFERIKEEYGTGKSRVTSFKNGFKKALSAVLDGNITTFLGGLILYFMDTGGAIDGFAITLMYSIVISLITSLLLTRLFLKLLSPLNGKDKAFGLKLKPAKEVE